MIAILKLSCFYCPIALEHPDEHKHYILKNTKSRCIINYENFNIITIQPNMLDTFDFVFLPQYDYLSTDIAYVMYTSGSTGRPKGSMIKHESIINLINFYTDNISFNIVGQSFRYMFDGSVRMIFLALLNGKTLVLLPKITEQTIFFNQIIKFGINLIGFSPSFYIYHTKFIQHYFNNKINIFIGGEKSAFNHTDLLQFSKNNIQLYNCYSPTECCVNLTMTKFTNNTSIGKPIYNTTIRILNSNMEIVPINTKGEIYASGIPLAKGYLHDEINTQKNFIQHPKFGRMYKQVI